MNDSQIHRDIARLQAEVESQHEVLNETRADVKAMKSQLDQMKGGKAALFGLLSFAGGLGAVITHAIHWLRG